MKKLLMSIAALAMCSTVAFAEDTDVSSIDNTLYLDKATVSAGSEATVSLKMKNTAGVQAIGAYITLPEGVTIKSVELGSRAPEAVADVVYVKTNRVEGVDRIALLSGNGVAMTGNDGEVIKVTLNVAETVANGDYDITISNQELCTADNAVFGAGQSVVSTLTVGSAGVRGDVNGDGKVTITDVTLIVDHINNDTYAENADLNDDKKITITDVTLDIDIINAQ